MRIVRTNPHVMKTTLFWAAVLISLLMSAPASAQLFDNLRALGGTRYAVGDPALVVTNLYGQRVDGPKDVAVGDLDNDGYQDFAAANKDGTVTVRFNNRDGTFGLPLHLHTVTNGPSDLRCFYTTNYFTNVGCNFAPSYYYYTNYGPPNPPTVFSNLQWSCDGSYYTNYYTNISVIEGPVGLRGLALADFTGDGREDIAVASPGESKVYLFRNQGFRNFAAPTVIPAWFGARDLAAGDFDGDGLVDLAVAGTTNGLAQYRSLGGGNFVLMTNITKLSSTENFYGDYDFPQPAYYLKVLRQAGDTKDELLISFAQRGKLSVLRAGADGRLAISGEIPGTAITAFDAAPLLTPASNNVPDLVTSYAPAGIVDIFPATNGLARFSPFPITRLFVPGGPRNVRIADLDQDGWNDLVVVSQLSDAVLIYKNNHGQLSQVASAVAGRFPREMDLGDFNADGFPDLAVLNRTSSDVSIMLTATNLAAAVGFLALDSVYAVDGGLSGLELRDVNEDGRVDVVQLHRDSGEFSVRLTSTNGHLSAPAYYPITNAFNPAAQIATDVNGDGRPDMVSANLSGSVTVRLARAGGGFGDPQTFALPADATGSLFALVPGDFDGDGHIDLAAGYLDCRVSFFRGDGAGQFTFTHTHPFIYEPRSMVAGDFDQDGDLDLAGAAWNGKFVVVNNPGNLLDAVVLNKTIYTGLSANNPSMRLVDQNHDGDPDFLFGSEGGFDLFLGGPGLSFTHQFVQNGNTPGIASATFVYADLNGDGQNDIASIGASNASLTISIFTNNQYIPVLTVPVPTTRYLAAGDLDGDGFVDLVGSGDVLWVALSGHRASNASPAQLLAARNLNRRVVINELLAQNDGLALAADGNRFSDWVELYNGSTQTVSLLNWQLLLVRTNTTTTAGTNFIGGTNVITYTTNSTTGTNTFLVTTNAIMVPGGFRLAICSTSLRSPFHTGFSLPAEGATLILLNAQGVEQDRVTYPVLGSDLSYARYQDGLRSFVVNNIPSPGAPNVDNGAVNPVITFDGINLEAMQAEGPPVRFQATARDDQGIVNVSVLWRRLNVADNVTKRVILYDDGMNDGDAVLLDGIFTGTINMPEPFPPGTAIQFYLECTDISGQVVTRPGNGRFAASGVSANVYTFAIGVTPPALEISEIVADNSGGVRDESGGSPSWVEIRNTSGVAVPMAGVGLSPKFFGDSERMVITNVSSLAPGQHLIIYCDGKPSQGPLHAPFKLNGPGGQIFLTGTTAAGARYLIDQLAYGPQTRNTALARLGRGGPWSANAPTPAAGNISGLYKSLVLSNVFTLAFPTRNDRSYVIQYTDNLGTNWVSLPPVPGLGVEQAVTQPLVPHRFFRVREQ